MVPVYFRKISEVTLISKIFSNKLKPRLEYVLFFFILNHQNFCQRRKSGNFQEFFFSYKNNSTPLKKVSTYCNWSKNSCSELAKRACCFLGILRFFWAWIDCQRSSWQWNSVRITVRSEFFYFIQIPQTFWQNYLLQLFLVAKNHAQN